MKKQTIKKIAGVLVPASLFLGLALPALAYETSAGQSAPSAGAGMATPAIATANTAVERANAAIEKRVNDLTTLIQRIAGMKHVSDATKATITTALQADITALNNLKTKIASDSATELRTDLKSITGSYRVYALVMPETRILVAADKAVSIADMMIAMNVKLQTRVTAAATAGKDMSAITAAQTDLTAKLADAKTQAQNAISMVAGLTPDNGDQTKLHANEAALKTARTDIQAAQKDLEAARADLHTIIKALKEFGMNKDAGMRLNGDTDKDGDNH